VAAYALDQANGRSWIGALTAVTVLTIGPVGVGTRVQPWPSSSAGGWST
jgi:hypothetical protein